MLQPARHADDELAIEQPDIAAMHFLNALLLAFVSDLDVPPRVYFAAIRSAWRARRRRCERACSETGETSVFSRR